MGISLAFSKVIELEIFGLLLVLIDSLGFLISAAFYAYKMEKNRGKEVNFITYIY